MQRGAVSKLIADYLAEGGEVTRVAEGVVTLDWSETRERSIAARAGRRGHERRWGRKAA